MRTLFLSSIPSFISGCARLLDIGGVYDIYNENRDGNAADVRAIYSDFRMVGRIFNGRWRITVRPTDKLQRLSIASTEKC